MKKPNEEMFKDFGREVIAKSFTPNSIEDYFKSALKFGSVWSSAWLSVALKLPSGKRYAFVREYRENCSILMLSFNVRDDLLEVSSKFFDKPYLGKIIFDRVEGQEAAIIKSPPSKHNFQIQINVDKQARRITWQEENGAIDLQFESLGPALSFYIPSGRVQEELYYTSELFRATGKVLGETVIGYGSLDQSWITKGINWFGSKGFLFFEDIWVIWANRYPDGSMDYGIGIFGPENWNVCFYVDGGQAITPKNNTIDIKYTEEGYPSMVDLTMDNKNYQFQWNCERRLLEVKGAAQWTHGQMLNLAKKDKPVEGYAWVEDIIFHKRNLSYSLLKRGANFVARLPKGLKARIMGKLFLKGIREE